MYPVSNGYATALFTGDAVELSAGYVTQYDLTGTALGVAMGFGYVNTEGVPTFSRYLPAATSSTGEFEGFTTPFAYVVDDPDATYVVKANATVSRGDIGDYFGVSIGSGSTFTGLSGMVVDASAGALTTAADADVQVLGYYPYQENAETTAAPYLEVKFIRNGPTVG